VKKVIMGNHALSYGAKLSRVQVIAAYPITPQTQVVEALSEFVANGELNAKFIKVESEHSAMSACIAASGAGVRTFTATSAHGLALMHEMLHWACGARLPIVMADINRAMGPPWTVWTEQTDSLAQRDTGWLQFYCESNQEVLDTVIQGYKIAERLLLPVMIVLDAFFLSHTCEPVDIPDIEIVDTYLPPYKPEYKLDIKNPHSFGAITMPDLYMELRYMIQKDMERASEVVLAADKEFEKIFGRSYGITEEYRCEDAEIILVTSATIASTSRIVIDELRNQGHKVGMLKIRMFRPFPEAEVRQKLKKAKKVAVIDRNISFGVGGIFCQEIKAALCNEKEKPLVFGFIAGLGGRDVTPEVIKDIYFITLKEKIPKQNIYWMGVKL